MSGNGTENITKSNRCVDAKELALEMVSLSSSLEFDHPLLCAQWCRDVAKAGLADDVDKLHELESEQSY